MQGSWVRFITHWTAQGRECNSELRGTERHPLPVGKMSSPFWQRLSASPLEMRQPKLTSYNYPLLLAAKMNSTEATRYRGIRNQDGGTVSGSHAKEGARPRNCRGPVTEITEGFSLSQGKAGKLTAIGTFHLSLQGGTPPGMI